MFLFTEYLKYSKHRKTQNGQEQICLHSRLIFGQRPAEVVMFGSSATILKVFALCPKLMQSLQMIFIFILLETNCRSFYNKQRKLSITK